MEESRVLILVHWREEGKWDLLRSLEAKGISVDLLQPYFPFLPDSPFNRFCPWLAEFYLPLIAMSRRNRFDIIVTWSMRMGVCLGLLNRLLLRGSRPKHVIQDFHIDLTRKDIGYKQKLKLLKWAVEGIDFFLCTSNQEAEIYTKIFQIPREKIRFFPVAPPRHFLEIEPLPRGDYLFSYGNSDRDFETLLRVVRELHVPTVILSQRYRPSRPLPSNVTLIGERITLSSMIQWIMGARCVVLPLEDRRVAAGQIAMLETMALGSPLVISYNWATQEYAVHGREVLFFEPGDVATLKEAIHCLWEQPQTASAMGTQARKAAALIPERQVSAFVDLLRDLQPAPGS